MGQGPELEPELPEGQAALQDTNRVGWHLLHFLRDSLTSLEEQATRVLAAEVAGLIAVWSQLHTFERGLPRSLVWAAWGFTLAAPIRLGPLVTPKRLGRFWAGLPVKDTLQRGDHIDGKAEARLIMDLSEGGRTADGPHPPRPRTGNRAQPHRAGARRPRVRDRKALARTAATRWRAAGALPSDDRRGGRAGPRPTTPRTGSGR